MPLPIAALAALGGGALLGRGLQGFFQARGARQAARTQAGAAREAMGRLEQLYGRAGAAISPYQQAGARGLEALTAATLGGEFATPVPEFQYEPFQLEADPGFQFRLEQGQRAIERGAAARGGALGGATLQELQRMGQGLAAEEAQRAYQRYAGERGFQYGALGDIYRRQVQQQALRQAGLAGFTGIGQQAAGLQAQLATGLGGGLAGLITGRGAAEAAGQAARARALGGFFGGLGQDVTTLAGLYGLGAFGGRQPAPFPAEQVQEFDVYEPPGAWPALSPPTAPVPPVGPMTVGRFSPGFPQ